MMLPRLCIGWIWVIAGFMGVQSIIFDVLRNSSALTAHDTCATLRCQARVNDRGADDIRQIISLVISERDVNRKSGKPLASLSFFDAEVHILGDESKRIYATGELLSKEGELVVHMKDAASSCQSGVFMCEMRYINNEGKGKVVTAEKQLQKAVKQTESSHYVSDTLKTLKTLIADEVAKLSEQAENVTAGVVSIATSLNERLLRIESMIEKDLHARLHSLDLKLDKLEVLLNNNADLTLRSLTETVVNSTEDIKSHFSDGILQTQRQVKTVQASVTDRLASTESFMNDSFRVSMESHLGCKQLQANVSSMFHQIIYYVSTFKTDIMGRLSTVDTNVESSSSLMSTRLIMESLVRIVNNVSTFDSRLVKLKSDFDTEMKTVRQNMTSLNENLANRHFRFTREIKQNISSLENLLAEKFKDLENQKQSLSSLGQEMSGKLLNIEINLKDVNIVVRSIKYIFGL